MKNHSKILMIYFAIFQISVYLKLSFVIKISNGHFVLVKKTSKVTMEVK